MPELVPGQVVLATFQPRRKDDLKIGAAQQVDRLGAFEVLWLIEDGEYEGEFAMRLPADWLIEGAIWVPSGDLTVVAGDTRGQEPQGSRELPAA